MPCYIQLYLSDLITATDISFFATFNIYVNIRYTMCLAKLKIANELRSNGPIFNYLTLKCGEGQRLTFQTVLKLCWGLLNGW